MNFNEFIDLFKRKVQRNSPSSTTTTQLSDSKHFGQSFCPKCGECFPTIQTVCYNDGYILVPVNKAQNKERLLGRDTTVLEERFKITRHIGRGSLHDVYEAEDQRKGQKCAVKVLRFDLSRDQKIVRRYSSEIAHSAKLDHPNIAKMIAHGTVHNNAKEIPLSVVEWLDGESLRKRISKERIGVSQLIDLCTTVCQPLSYAHDRGIIHRDLRPSNIFLLSGGTIKLTDFGLGERLLRDLDWAQSPSSNITRSTYGDPGYLDPEYAKTGKATRVSDIYSIGCILHECLTGSPPFGGDNEVQILIKHLNEEAKPVSAKRPELSGTGIDELVQKCLAKKSEDRYQSARELSDALLTVRSSVAGFA